jgi:hypothetical protein
MGGQYTGPMMGPMDQGGQQPMGGQYGGDQMGGQYGGMMGPSDQKGGRYMMGPGDQMGGQMDEERMKKEEEMRRKHEEEGSKRCLKEMAKGIGQFEKSAIKEIDKALARAKKAGVSVPQDLLDTILNMKALIAKIKQATTCEEAQAAQEELSVLQENMSEWMGKLHFLAEVPKILKQINAEYKRIDKVWTKAKKTAAASKVDLSELVAQGQAIFDDLKALFARVISVVQSGDVEQMEELMGTEEEGMAKMDALMEVINTIEAVRNTGKFLQQMNQGLNNLKRIATQLKRQKKDVTELNTCIQTAKGVVEIAKARAKQKPIDIDVLIDGFGEAQDALNGCEEIANELQGREETGMFDQFFTDEMQKSFMGPRGGEGGGQGAQTCNVNGVEMPGSCDQYQGMNR